MHSSRMHTSHSISHLLGGGDKHPKLPPWVWTWTRSPSTSPLAVGLDQIPLNFPLGCGSGPDSPQLPLGCGPGDPHGTRDQEQIPRRTRSRHPPGPGADTPQDQEQTYTPSVNRTLLKILPWPQQVVAGN